MDLALTDNININLKFNSTTYEVRKVIVNQNGYSYVAYEKIDYSQEYFTIESLEDNNTVTIIKNANAPSITLYYSIDNGSTWSSFSTTKSWILNKGDKVKIKATANQYSGGSSKYWHFLSTNQYKVYGNIMSLLYGDNFASQTTLPNYSYVFTNLFYNSNKLVDASKLILSATTLRTYCYTSMFEGCTSLIDVPELPATTLEQYCYSSMFNGCTSLMDAPEIKATTMQQYCCSSMFNGCISLVNVPTLSATTLANACYQQMFMGCTALVNAPTLPATTMKDYCYYSMFRNCTSLVRAPELKSSNPKVGSYGSMFSGCSSLNYIKCLATTFGSNACSSWVNGVAASGTFVKKSTATWSIGVNGIPSGWTVKTA